MADNRRNVRIIVILLVVLLVIGGSIGLAVGLGGHSSSPVVGIELEVWPRSEKSEREPLIQFDPGNQTNWHIWYERINDFLKEYETSTPESPPRAPCSTDRDGSRGEDCQIAMSFWGPCTADSYYGYARGAPCVFLRLSNIHDWVPETFNRTLKEQKEIMSPCNTPDCLPAEMPLDLRQHIRLTSGRPEANTVWVSCEGVNPADQEYIGPVQYIPQRGFPADFFRFSNQEGYHSPLVAVLFERPEMSGVLINVECRVWARNIQYDSNERRGSVRFGLMAGSS